MVQLEIAARRLVPRRGGGPAVWLTGASHLGEAAYYQALQRHLDTQQRVLFEGVSTDPDSGPASQPKPAPQSAESKGDGKPAPEAGLQAALAESLGLEFQLNAVDYQRPHFVGSDLSVEELRRLLTETMKESSDPGAAARSLEQLLQMMQGDSFFANLAAFGLKVLGSHPRFRALARLMLVETIGQLQGDLGGVTQLPPDVKALLQVLVEERNKRVVDDLRRELARADRRSSLAIFYGAAHMRDLEQRICRQFHYAPDGETWFPAIRADLSASGVGPMEIALVRDMVSRQVKALTSPPTTNQLQQPNP